MNIGIVGSRSITDMECLRQAMQDSKVPEPTMIISGGAAGVDSLAQSFAKENGLPIKIYYPNWNKYGKGAGFKRNNAIIDESQFVVVIWDGDSSGACHDVNLCISKRKPCRVFCHGSPSKITAEDIRGFQDNHRWLSNMWYCDVTFGRLTFPASENAYQALKFKGNLELIQEFTRITPLESKVLARQTYGSEPELISPDFSLNKYRYMEMVVRQKFTQNPYLAKKLILTGEVYLEEKNTWKDTYWGVCDGQGENNLGKILMDIRSSLV